MQDGGKVFVAEGAGEERGKPSMAGAIYLLNGPNLNLLGQREPEIYGSDTLADVEARCRAAAETHGFTLIARQTNREYEMIDWLQEARTAAAGVVINPAAFSYHSVPILDAMKMVPCPIVEVHISNIHRREAWRAHTLLSQAATGTIVGLGTAGYELAIDYLARAIAS